MSPTEAPRPSALGTVGRAAAFFILLALLAVAAGALIAPLLVWLAGRTGQRVRVDMLAGLVASFGATAIMLHSVDVRPWRDVGLGREAARRIGAGFLVGGVAIGAACAALFVLGWLRVTPTQPGSSLGAAARISFFLIPAALSEELVCRGYLLTVLRDRLGTWRAVATTSVLFGLLHVANAGATLESVAIVTLAGIFLGAVRVAYDSLYAAWSAHAAWNLVMAVPLHAPVSGLRFESPDYRTVSAGPEWITGGAWGPEGGLAAAVAMLGGLAYLYARHRREES